MYKTTVTNQGTISIPILLREKYNLTAGEKLIIEDDNGLIIKKMPNFAAIRTLNQSKIKKGVIYKAGDGFEAHVTEKYGSK